ncbi:hypothetical protein CRN80_08470 [Pseudomonas sp. FDAARGOS_380]|uniref:hypothetical protein n=1 Tax=Pseudomonas TaxID=286 RepID=UPI000BFE6250|nr:MULTISPECIES: hypothetical protein [Pseudomonas]ATN09689.1 hypothetical protein CRN80_08470 [Pseudomonas sp. FDAARGOS_380]MDH0796154.1 hypothetical protein [Pseudomonas carnis]NNA89881.1 hypothetical protein [Pseudomonas gessardii]
MTKKFPIIYPDHPLYTDAVEAVKRYHDAQVNGCPDDEIRRLRQIAETQFRAVNEYQLSALGRQPCTVN